MKRGLLTLFVLAAVAISLRPVAAEWTMTPATLDEDRTIVLADSIDGTQPHVETRFFAAPVDTFGTFSLFGAYRFGASFWDSASDDSVTLGTASDIGGSWVMLISNTPIQIDTVFAVGNALNSDDSLGVAAAEDTSWFYMASGDTAGMAYQSDKRFAGLVTLHRFSAAANSRQLNYALVDYWNDRGTDFTLTDVEIGGWGGATDASFNIWIRKHQLTGWSFDGTGVFSTGNYPTPLVKIGDTQGTDIDLAAFTHFAWNQRDVGEAFDVSANEGLVIDVKTSVANSLPSLNATIVYTE